MAYTATLLYTTVFGNKRVMGYDVTADAASGSVQTGLKDIECILQGFVSCATVGFKVKPDLSAASGVLAGSVLISSAANGDRFFIQVYGK